MKVGDLVKRTYRDNDHNYNEELGIVVEIQTGNYAQVKVAASQGIAYWWPAVTEVVDESR
tara:strand:- start:195 stop:374 length:180 start_codon:yes stop_codon:yes gene_type:complete